ncbi:MAG: putative toxin-antitoxin system toxin component, PIN family [Acidobacteriaceae bacterium]|nr:putative toxin-antitoxin system toxin component, PIN family [Acidobacteriaceae bacterium]
MKRLTLDSNIYISAFEFGGMPLRLLEQARAGEIEIAIPTPIIREIQRVLHEKFHWPEDRLEQLERNISQFTKHVEPTQTLDIVKSDPDDNRILECAVVAGSEAIVTGDKKHLLPLRNYQGIKIIQVSEILAKQREQ